jgi:hypothetical protein
MAEVWKSTNRLKAIYLYLLILETHKDVLSSLQAYVGGVHEQIEAEVEKGNTWHQIEKVDMVVLPVKVAGTWALYLTQRSTKQQSVLRHAIRVRKVEATNSVALGAIYILDRIMHTLGGSVMTIYLKTRSSTA